MKILIVDDSETERLLLKYLLDQSGFETAEASDGIEGLKMASQQKPDLIISDANMPRMDGFQFLRRIKQDEKLRGIPFVFYSALYTGYREAELATSLGAEAFIIKPKEPKEFIEELKIIIEEIGQTKIITAKLIEKDEEYLRQYARIVAAKLEEKVRELEKACAESRQKEESFKESEARLRSIFRAAPIGIGLVSADRRLLQVNDRLCEITGFSSDELIGQNARILYPTEEDYEYVGKTKYAQIRERGTGTVETRWKRKDGTVIDILLSSSPIDPADLSRGVTFTALDITERKKAENARKESEERFRSLTESTSDWIWETDQDGIYTYASPKIIDLLGYTPEEIIGKTPFDLMPPEEAERVSGIFNELRTRRMPLVKIENTNLHKDRRPVELETSGVPFFDSEGNLKGYRGIDRDITDRKHYEELLKKSDQELKKRLKELEEFYNIAVGRESRMIQMKKEMEKLMKELGKYRQRGN